MKLSKRLELLAYLVEKHKKGNILADIGTDHAYLPCYLVEKNIISYEYSDSWNWICWFGFWNLFC